MYCPSLVIIITDCPSSPYIVLSLQSHLQGILIVLWKLISGEISGIFIGVNVLDTTTNFGQVCITYVK